MEKEIHEWNGFKVKGDVEALDQIVSNSGLINLDMNDIEITFIGEGENWVVSVSAANLSEAVAEVKNRLTDKTITRMTIALFYRGDMNVKEVRLLSDLASEPGLNLKFGFFKEPKLEVDVKLVVAFKTKPCSECDVEGNSNA